jgi:hypothetical protein
MNRATRWWILVPALVSVLAAVVAIVILVAPPRGETLSAARRRLLPAALLQRDLASDLHLLDALLMYVGETNRFNELVAQPEEVMYTMLDRLDANGAAALGERPSKELTEELTAYWEAASRATAMKVSDRLRRQAERARKRPGSGGRVDGAALEEAGDVSARLERLDTKLQDGAASALAALDAALAGEEAQRRARTQRATAVLLAGMLVSILLAAGGFFAAGEPTRAAAAPPA